MTEPTDECERTASCEPGDHTYSWPCVHAETAPAPSAALNAAADYLLEHGWQQDGLGCHGGPRCAMGALKSVLGETTILSTVESPEYAALRAHLGGYVSDWNDTPGRTVEEVTAALREAAIGAAS